ncbi:MAG: hypothetical protein MRY59_03745 [Aquisalinus sp.]|nr:hypothetical protein [Aquisalinus sp.]
MLLIRKPYLLWLALTASASISLANATDLALDPGYQACVDKVRDNPEQGRYQALRWVSDGGGDPALYCAAIADLAIGVPRLAAERLEVLAKKNRTPDPYLSARLYVQAAQAWAAGRETLPALAAIAEAERMAPATEEVKLLIAPIYAEIGRWGLTKRSLDAAEEFNPLSASALTLRARARKELSDTEGAARDLQLALNMEPENIEALVLRGELAQAGYIIDPYTAAP